MSRFYRKIGSWLGLFAILMATLAPTLSHSLALHGGGDMGMEGEHCAMPEMAAMPAMDSMPAMAPAPDHASGQSAGKPAPHSTISGGDACGYCSLLAHMPVVPGVEAMFSVTVRALQHAVATRFERVRRVEPLTFTQPRAPPFTS